MPPLKRHLWPWRDPRVGMEEMEWQLHQTARLLALISRQPLSTIKSGNVVMLTKTAKLVTLHQREVLIPSTIRKVKVIPTIRVKLVSFLPKRNKRVKNNNIKNILTLSVAVLPSTSESNLVHRLLSQLLTPQTSGLLLTANPLMTGSSITALSVVKLS